ncbi:hypothetical protein BC567DRAFT_210240 [Phyllosticta citribraziliensis]
MTSDKGPTVRSAITASRYVQRDSTLALSNSPFGKLPNEIIEIILEYVERNTHFSEYKQCLLACTNSPFGKLPDEIFEIILYYVECNAGFSEYKHGFLSFAWRFPAQLYVAVESLTIGLYYPSWTYPLPSDRETLSIPPNVHWNPSQQFLDILPKLTNLRTFSLQVEAFDDYPTSLHFVEEVLRLLPDSVTYLELDTGCSRRNRPRFIHFHVCEALGKIMPRLKALSLRTKYVCEALFGISRPGDEPHMRFPRLEQLLIEIPNVHTPQPMRYTGLDLWCGYHAGSHTPRAYLPDIRRMKARGAFPALLECVMYFRKRVPPPDAQGVLSRTNSGFHLLINVLREESLVVPYQTPEQRHGARVLCARGYDGDVVALDDEFSRLCFFGFWATLRNGVRSHACPGPPCCSCHIAALFLSDRFEPGLILHELRPDERWGGLSRRSVLFEGAFELHSEYGFVPLGYDVRYSGGLFRLVSCRRWRAA